MEWREQAFCRILEEAGKLVTIITGNLNKIFPQNEVIKKQTWSLLDDDCFMERRFFSQTIKFALEEISVSI